MNKQYLGDAVHVEVERGMLKLTAEDGVMALHTIYLEPEVFQALVEYVERVKRPTDQPKPPNGESDEGK